jgi:hypothetical protein
MNYTRSLLLTLGWAAVLVTGSVTGVRAAAQPYIWKNVTVMAGGFIPGIIFNLKQPGLVYCRSDIGSSYKWDNQAQRFMADPQGAIRRLKQAREPAVVQFRVAVAVKDREPHSVKARQSVVCGHPEVAVAGLQHGGDGILRQPVLAQPVARGIPRRPWRRFGRRPAGEQAKQPCE